MKSKIDPFAGNIVMLCYEYWIGSNIGDLEKVLNLKSAKSCHLYAEKPLCTLAVDIGCVFADLLMTILRLNGRGLTIYYLPFRLIVVRIFLYFFVTCAPYLYVFYNLIGVFVTSCLTNGGTHLLYFIFLDWK